MVSQAQVRNAEPLLKQIDALNAMLASVTTASSQNWTIVGPLYFHDSAGNTQEMDISGLPSADLINALWTSGNALLSNLNAQLAAI